MTVLIKNECLKQIGIRRAIAISIQITSSLNNWKMTKPFEYFLAALVYKKFLFLDGSKKLKVFFVDEQL
jgi:hypothetical protein